LLKPGASLGQDELVTWARKRMANYKVPRYLQVFESFPLNASNKVVKRELGQLARQRLAVVG
jgi:acyl-coenzyme A synthetase/AMP-(fatty) acid ligase